MARIKLGPVVTDISGSIGGITIQRSKFGLTMRSKPLPVLSATAAQLSIRSKMRIIQNAWRALSDAQRLQWDRFPNFSGQTIRRDRSVLISGYTLYLMYQLYHLINDQSLYTTIAYAPLPDIPNFIELSYSDTTLYAIFDAVVDPAELFFILKLGYPRSVAQKYNLRGLRFIKAPWTATASFDITASFLAAFGFIPPDVSYLSYSFRYFSTVSPVVSGVFTGSIPCIHE
ncbi:hypothetical protein ES703_81892 [subsurface metagenome]